MKYQHLKYASEPELLQAVVGFSELKTERINKPFHHQKRVRIYPGTEIVKKYRSNNPRAINKTYREANAHISLDKIGVNVPKLFGILHSDKECSLFMQYIKYNPLTSLIISSDSNLPQNLVLAGRELGKMFEYGFLHGDLTSYHILASNQIYVIDLEATRQFQKDEFHKKLIKEWEKFIDSTQGKRWRILFSKEQEEMVFEGVQQTLSNRKTREVLENIILRNVK
ncbi:MAG: hypothetical protein KJ646_01235 [Nanoarchaeota archaeon]|nr:hypothetical protein [Nanoarchaeota archaeon]MBU4116788.1 hypothetical protein [Nanoarchaeota archaeon]